MKLALHWSIRRALSTESPSILLIAVARRLPLIGRLLPDRSLDSWSRPHPFDARFGTDTAGHVSARHLRSGQMSDPYITGYAGCQPSIVRRMLAHINNPPITSFVDLGCGKGRALIVASEFGFKAVVGVELAPTLCVIARSNAALIADRFPERPRIEIVQGDAVEYRPPSGPLTIFLNHPFRRVLMHRLMQRLEHALTEEAREIHIVYCNAVLADIIDQSPGFSRIFDGVLTSDPDEHGYAPAMEEPVAIWRGGSTDKR